MIDPTEMLFSQNKYSSWSPLGKGEDCSFSYYNYHLVLRGRHCVLLIPWQQERKQLIAQWIVSIPYGQLGKSGMVVSTFCSKRILSLDRTWHSFLVSFLCTDTEELCAYLLAENDGIKQWLLTSIVAISREKIIAETKIIIGILN